MITNIPILIKNIYLYVSDYFGYLNYVDYSVLRD